MARYLAPVLAIALSVVMLLASVQRAAAQAQLDPGFTSLEVNGANNSSDLGKFSIQSPNSVPYTYNDSVSDTGYSSAAKGSLTSSDFSLSFTQSQNGAQGALAEAQGDVFFSLSSNSKYSLSGLYSALDTSTANDLFLSVILTDDTTNTTLFLNNLISRNTLNPAFTLGGNNGDTLSQLQGSLTGTLNNHDLYDLYYNYYIEAYPNSDGGSTATGNVNLQLTPSGPSSIPLPMAVYAAVPALLTLAGLLRGKQKLA